MLFTLITFRLDKMEVKLQKKYVLRSNISKKNAPSSRGCIFLRLNG